MYQLLVWLTFLSLLHESQGRGGGLTARSPLQHRLLKNPCNFTTVSGEKVKTTPEQYYCYQKNATKSLIVLESTYTIGGYQINQWNGYDFYIDSTGMKQTHYWWGNVFTTTGQWSGSSYGWSEKAQRWERWATLTKVADTLQINLDTRTHPLGKPEPFGEFSNPECHGLTVCVWRPHATDPCENIFLCPNLTIATPNEPIPDLTPGPKSTTQHFAQTSVHDAMEFGSTGDSHIEFHDAKDNTWYRALLQILAAGHVNEPCYACTFMPHTASHSALTRPNPYDYNSSMCILKGILNKIAPKGNTTMGHKKVPDTLFKGWFKTNNSDNQCSPFNNSLIRFNQSTKYMDGQYRPVMTIPPEQMPKRSEICFKRQNERTDNVLVGTTANCNIIVEATCGSIWNLTKCNVTEKPDVCSLGGIEIHCPSDDGALMVTDGLWMCGDQLYATLPPHWQGTCSIVYLSPTVSLYSNLTYTTHHYPHYRQKREEEVDSDKEHLLTSEGTKFVAGLFPWWGTVNNAHNVDKLHVQLENLTRIVSDAFAALTPWSAAVRATLIQHRMALDLLLASQGGLCHVIGDKCCTYIPDISGNMSVTVDHLNTLLANMKKDDVKATSSGWDWWSWLSWDWKGKLLTLATPVIAIIIMLCICTTCVVPLIKKCITNLIAINIQAALLQYEPLPLHDDALDTQDGAESTPEPSDSEAEDSV